MKKKRFIMHNTALTTYTAPAVLVEEYDRQIKEFGFKDKQEILVYLAVGLYNERNGIKNSRTVREILRRVSVERSPVLQIFPRVYRGMQMRVECKDKILSLSNFGYLSNLMNAVMEAFLASGRTEKRMLRREMHVRYVRETSGSEWLQTYISESQYDKLFDMAIHSGMSFTGMVRSAIRLVLASEDILQDGYPVPFEVQEGIQELLCIEGFTLHHFSRKIQFRIRIGSDELYNGICYLIQHYEIPGPSEFLRRVLLFLLDTKGIGFRYVPDELQQEESDYFDEDELYHNERLSRKDFARSIYQ